MSTRLIPLLLGIAAMSLNARAFAQPFPNDNDGLLDVGEAPRFPNNPEAAGRIDLTEQNIEDLDGANLMTNAWSLGLGGNQITSIENGAFEGLTRLELLTSLENGAFKELKVAPADARKLQRRKL